jgi:hypothetical protein
MFYTFNQNNSGGSFKKDKYGLTHIVIIEANSAEEANSKAESLGIYFNGCDDERDCPCCGDRWYPVNDSDGTKMPEIYKQSPQEYTQKAMCLWMEKGREVCVHYADGRQEWF